MAWLGIVGIWVAWAGMTYGWYKSAHAGRCLVVQPARPVVCIGDSLTAFGYPRRLQEMISLPVVDLSCNGITTGDAIRRLPSLIKANPQVVVIELGGHDFLKGYSRAATRENLEKIVDACRSIGAEGYRDGDSPRVHHRSFRALEREMAREESLELIPDTAIRRLVLWSPVRAARNVAKAGIASERRWLAPELARQPVVAEYVADALTRIYGSGVRASP